VAYRRWPTGVSLGGLGGRRVLVAAEAGREALERTGTLIASLDHATALDIVVVPAPARVSWTWLPLAPMGAQLLALSTELLVPQAVRIACELNRCVPDRVASRWSVQPSWSALVDQAEREGYDVVVLVNRPRRVIDRHRLSRLRKRSVERRASGTAPQPAMGLS
jgi:hypothetical protein